MGTTTVARATRKSAKTSPKTEPALVLRKVSERDGLVTFQVAGQKYRGTTFAPNGGASYTAYNGVSLESSGHPEVNSASRLYVRGSDVESDEARLTASKDTWRKYRRAVAAYNAAWAAKTAAPTKGALTLKVLRTRGGQTTFRVERQPRVGLDFNPGASDGRFRTFRAPGGVRLRSNFRPEWDARKRILFVQGSKVARRRDGVTVTAGEYVGIEQAVADYNRVVGAWRPAPPAPPAGLTREVFDYLNLRLALLEASLKGKGGAKGKT
jgi:hypothetical protein